MRLLLVDDHALVRRGLAHVVRECFDDADVVEAAGADDALEALRSNPVDVALLDVRLGEEELPDGLDLLHEIKATWPDTPVIMLTTYDHARYARRALAEGAAGYMLKDSAPTDLAQAIRVALSGGGNVLSSRIIQNLFESDGPDSDDGQPATPPEVNLTPRETDILELVVEGKSNRDVAEALFLSEKTVKAHLAAIFRKMGVSNRTQAAMGAVAMGVGRGRPREVKPASNS
ncbi:MAG: response regulator transcription factor [Actinomycetota bacterium]